MVFNDTTNLDGIIQECEMKVFGENYGAISGNTTLLKRFTALCNTALDKVTHLILTSDTRWQWADSNYDDMTPATTDMTDNVSNYRLSTSHIKILGVEVKKTDGTWVVVKPLDQADIQRQGIALDEFMNVKGVPQFYDKVGDVIKLYPAPDSAQVSCGASSQSLALYFQEGAEHFEYTDTTKEPGFVSLFHYIIPLYASLDYAKGKIMTDTVVLLRDELKEAEDKLVAYFSKRDKDDKPKLKAKKHNYK